MEREGATFHAVDAGPGNMFFWASPAADILIDASLPVPVRGSATKEPLKYLQRMGASSPINLLIFTAPEPDQVNETGLTLVTRSFALQEVWFPPLSVNHKGANEALAVLKKAKWSNGYTVNQVRGDLQRKFVCGDTNLMVLSPHPDDAKNSTVAPLVLRLEQGGFSCIVAGDCDQHRWESIVYHFHDELRSDVLVAPFHGASKGITAEALGYIRPSAVLASCGSTAEQVPDQDALYTYSQYVGGHIYLTCQRGNIRIWRSTGQIQLEWDRAAIA